MGKGLAGDLQVVWVERCWTLKWNTRDEWLDFIAFLMTVESDRQFDIEKAKAMGFATEIEKNSVIQGYGTAFERMRMAKRILNIQICAP